MFAANFNYILLFLFVKDKVKVQQQP